MDPCPGTVGQLKQAAAYVQATGTTMARYLPLFRERQADLMARGDATGHPTNAAATLGLALSRLAGEVPAATVLLRLLAFLAPEPVPLNLLLAGTVGSRQPVPETASEVSLLLGDQIAAGDAITALRRYSLISPAGDGLVIVHRLVQGLTRAAVPPQAAREWERTAASLIEGALPADPQIPSAWPTYAVLLPHARAVLDLTCGGMRKVTAYLGRSGSVPAARDLARLISDAHRDSGAHGPGHPATIAADHDLAHWTGKGGDPAAARDQLAALLPVCERVLGPQHPATLDARYDLAFFAGHAGDLARARDELAALLPRNERVLGPEHPSTLAIRAQLARWTGEAGDPTSARDQFAALLPVSEHVMGPEHPHTMSARHNFAYWTGDAGDPMSARDQLAALLVLYERIQGPEHPDTLTARHNLAYWTGEAGDPAAARDQFAALLPIREHVLGLQHPHSLTTRHDLACWTGEAGDPAAARDQFAALLPIREHVLGPEHPRTQATRDSLDHWTEEAEGAAPDAG